MWPIKTTTVQVLTSTRITSRITILETQSNADNGDKQFKPNALDERTLRSVRSQTTFAYIAGPVSLFVGGILLGTVGTICALLAYRKLRALMQKSNETATVAA